MNNHVILAGWWGVCLVTGSVHASDQKTLDLATENAVAQAVAGLFDAREATPEKFNGVQQVAVAPLWDDPEGYATQQVRSALANGPLELITREDETWDKLLEEIGWTERREDIMDPTTIQEFGKIKGVDALIYGTVRERSQNLWSLRAEVRMTLFLADVETGQILWSSGPVTGEAFVHWSDAVMRFWQYPVAALSVVLGAIVGLVMLCLIIRAFRRAMRPV